MNDVNKRFCICVHNLKITSINRKMVHKLYLQSGAASCYFILMPLLYLRAQENLALQSLATFPPAYHHASLNSLLISEMQVNSLPYKWIWEGGLNPENKCYWLGYFVKKAVVIAPVDSREGGERGK